VLCDDRTIFSRHESGRFPVDGEVEDLIAVLRGGPKPAHARQPAKGVLRRIADKFRN